MVRASYVRTDVDAVPGIGKYSREMMARVSDGILLLTGGRIRMANDVALELLERKWHEVEGMPPNIFIKGINEDGPLSGVRLMRDGTTFPVIGDVVWVERIGDGFIIFRDGQEEKRKLEERDLLAQVVESSGDGFIVIDPGNLIRILNRGAERLLDLGHQDVIDVHISVIWERFMEMEDLERLLRTIDDGKMWSGYREISSGDDGNRDISVKAWPIYWNRGGERFGIIQITDISETMELKRNLELMSTLLSHDVRNFDKAITDNLVMMKMGVYGNLNEKQTRVVERILSQSRQLNELLTNARRLLQIWEGDVRLEPIDLDPVIQWAADVVRSTYSERDVRFDIDIEESLPRVNADLLLRDVFQNLFDNSIRYSEDPVVITVKGRCDGDRIVVTVEDNGSGIEAKDMEGLFNKFEGGRDEPGSGLGLFLVSRLMRRYNGSIGLCRDGKMHDGACFVLRFGRVPDGGEIIIDTVSGKGVDRSSMLRVRRVTVNGEVEYGIGDVTVKHEDVWRVGKDALVERFGWNLAPVLERAGAELLMDGTYIFDWKKRRFVCDEG